MDPHGPKTFAALNDQLDGLKPKRVGEAGGRQLDADPPAGQRRGSQEARPGGEPPKSSAGASQLATIRALDHAKDAT